MLLQTGMLTSFLGIFCGRSDRHSMVVKPKKVSAQIRTCCQVIFSIERPKWQGLCPDYPRKKPVALFILILALFLI